jgi:hypothetical protein
LRDDGAEREVRVAELGVGASVTPDGEARSVSSPGRARQNRPPMRVQIARWRHGCVHAQAVCAAGAAWPKISTSTVRIAEDGKNPSTLEIERSFGGPWIVGYSDLAGR